MRKQTKRMKLKISYFLKAVFRYLHKFFTALYHVQKCQYIYVKNKTFIS